MKKILLFLLLSFIGVACKNASSGQITPQAEITNISYYSQKPIISAHRAGKGIAGYPENCLQTIQYLSKKGIHSFEIDIFESADGELFLMHDDQLGRTATGKGKNSFRKGLLMISVPLQNSKFLLLKKCFLGVSNIMPT